MLNGWIKIHRKILDHWVAQEPELLAVWVRLLLEANHADTKRMINGTLTTIHRGQVLFGLEAFSAKSGVSISKLRRYLKMLESEQMIDRQKTNRFSLISITYYEEHQADDRQTTSQQQSDNKPATSQRQHRKNVNNVNNDKEGKEYIGAKAPPTKRFIPPSAEEVAQYCKERGNTINPTKFVDYYTANGWMRGNTKIKDWKACVRTWEGKQAGRQHSSHGGQTMADFQADAAAQAQRVLDSGFLDDME